MERILIVDDEFTIRHLISEYLRNSGYHTFEASNAEEALRIIQNIDLELVISDIRMPGKDGLWLFKKIKELNEDLSIIMLTALDDTKLAVECLKMGAYDYLVKPFNPEELQISVKGALEKRRLILENREYQKYLEKKVRERTAELENAYQLTLMSLVNAIDVKEESTGNHSLRVAFYAEVIAAKMEIAQDEVADIWRGSLLHDLGKIGIPDSILLKKGPLNEEEWLIIKRHPVIGYTLIKDIKPLNNAAQIVLSHHERFDGKGYPNGLKGDQIPLGARIFSVVDAFDSITSNRPYRQSKTNDFAVEEIMKHREKQFDPEIVDVFLSIDEKVWTRIRDSIEVRIENKSDVLALIRKKPFRI